MSHLELAFMAAVVVLLIWTTIDLAMIRNKLKTITRHLEESNAPVYGRHFKGNDDEE